MIFLQVFILILCIKLLFALPQCLFDTNEHCGCLTIAINDTGLRCYSQVTPASGKREREGIV